MWDNGCGGSWDRQNKVVLCLSVKQEQQNTLSCNHLVCCSTAMTNKDWYPECAEECFVDHWSLFDLQHNFDSWLLLVLLQAWIFKQQGNERLICSAVFVVLPRRPVITEHGLLNSENRPSRFLRLVWLQTCKHCSCGWPQVGTGTTSCTAVDIPANSYVTNLWESQEPSRKRSNTSLVSVLLTFVVDEERVWSQRVLVVGDILQDVGQVHVHPDHAQEQVPEVTRPAHSHDEAWRQKK